MPITLLLGAHDFHTEWLALLAVRLFSPNRADTRPDSPQGYHTKGLLATLYYGRWAVGSWREST